MRSDITLFLCGDVMTGRGVDQILPTPSTPRLYEPYVSSAREYVALAERKHGRIPRSVDFSYPWGEALARFRDVRPDARIINLETSITTSDAAVPKGINYRMHPANVPVLPAAGITCCTLANNHVLDWDEAGLLETLDTLRRAGIAVTGAGEDLASASRPAVIQVPDGPRILVFAFGAEDAGVPPSWAAGRAGRPGVHVLSAYSESEVERLGGLVRESRRPGDVVIASVHWGPNWGYTIDGEHRWFAHALIERAGVDLVHGHSSHHPKALEVHRGKLILYGCGEFLNDYEGIRGHDEYRGDLVLMYFPTLDASTGELVRLRLIPLRIRKLRLERPSGADTDWLARRLEREYRRFGYQLTRQDGGFVLGWR